MKSEVIVVITISANYQLNRIIATALQEPEIPFLMLTPFENLAISSLKNVFNLQATVEDRFKAIVKLFDHFHWNKLNLIGVEMTGPILANFGQTINKRNWKLTSSQTLPTLFTYEDIRFVCDAIKKTGLKLYNLICNFCSEAKLKVFE